MFETYNTRRCEALVVSSMQALQLAKVPADANRRESTAVQANGNTTTQGGAAQSLSMTQAEMMMSSLVDEGWLEKSARGYYSLSPRGLMELRGWLVETYNDEDEEGHRARRVKFCAACKDILTVVCCLLLFGITLSTLDDINKTGSTMRGPRLPWPSARHVRTQFFPTTTERALPRLQDRVAW